MSAVVNLRPEGYRSLEEQPERGQLGERDIVDLKEDRYEREDRRLMTVVGFVASAALGALLGGMLLASAIVLSGGIILGVFGAIALGVLISGLYNEHKISKLSMEINQRTPTPVRPEGQPNPLPVPPRSSQPVRVAEDAPVRRPRTPPPRLGPEGAQLAVGLFDCIFGALR